MGRNAFCHKPVSSLRQKSGKLGGVQPFGLFGWCFLVCVGLPLSFPLGRFSFGLVLVCCFAVLLHSLNLSLFNICPCRFFYSLAECSNRSGDTCARTKKTFLFANSCQISCQVCRVFVVSGNLVEHR